MIAVQPRFEQHEEESKTPSATDAPELFLGQPERLLTQNEAIKFWNKAYGEDVLQSHEMQPYRVIAAWRLTRALAQKQGRLAPDESLEDIFADERDWTEPMRALAPSHPGDVPPDEWTLPQLISREGGLALTVGHEDRNHVKRFACAIEKLAEELWMSQGSERFPKMGLYGLHGLTHELTILKYWPRIRDIVLWETELITMVRDLVTKWPRYKVEKHVRFQLGLSKKEAAGVYLMATEYVRKESALDLDVKRAMMEASLEDIAFRARESMDIINELRARKAKAQVQGLFSVTPEDEQEKFNSIVADVSTDRRDSTLVQIEVHNKKEDNHD